MAKKSFPTPEVCETCHLPLDGLYSLTGWICTTCGCDEDSLLMTERSAEGEKHTHSITCPNCGMKTTAEWRGPEYGMGDEFRIVTTGPRQGKRTGRLYSQGLSILTFTDVDGSKEQVIVPTDSTITLTLVKQNLINK